MLLVENINKNYKKKKCLQGVNLTLKDGEVKALIGVNGSGKSTLVDIICGVKRADLGNIFINGLNARDSKLKNKIKKIIGYMPQSFSLFSDLTVKENVEYVASLYGVDDKRIEEVIDFCNLKPYINTLSANLSGGYKQLLSMASAIIHKPSILILDEPSSAMDPVFRNEFWQMIKKINKKGTSILLITHYIEELLECDTFSCLSDGVIKYDGQVEDFKEKGFINITEILDKFK